MPALPLVLTADPELLDEVLALAQAAGLECSVAVDLAQARAPRSGWDDASCVVVGLDALEQLHTAGLARRRGVVLVGISRADDPQPDPSLWQSAVEVGAEKVLFLPDAQAELIHVLADAAESTSVPALVVAVMGGRGGAGATTLAAALAVTAARAGHRTMLVDADPLGGGIDLVVGGEAASGLRWPQLSDAEGRVSARDLHDALPCVDGLVVLSWDRGDVLSVPAPAMAAVLAAASRACDVVVVDVPRHLDEATAAVLATASVALLVVPAEVRATAAAARVAGAAREAVSDLRLVVRGPAPAGLPAATIADALDLPLAGELRSEPGLAACLERGEPPAVSGRGPLAVFCADFLDAALSRLARDGRAA